MRGGGSLKTHLFFPVLRGCHLLSESTDDVVLVCTDILELTGRESRHCRTPQFLTRQAMGCNHLMRE